MSINTIKYQDDMSDKTVRNDKRVKGIPLG